jgi:hypothetical protein
MAYVIEREGRAGARFTGMYKAVDGKYKSAGTFESHERRDPRVGPVTVHVRTPTKITQGACGHPMLLPHSPPIATGRQRTCAGPGF